MSGPQSDTGDAIGCVFWCGIVSLAVGIGMLAGEGWGWIALGGLLMTTFVGFGLAALRRHASEDQEKAGEP